MAKLYGFGAAIVIVGAMFKIQHWPGAGPMLVVGLSTEAVIFFFSHLRSHMRNLIGALSTRNWQECQVLETVEMEIKDYPPVRELDNMLEDAKIGPELLESLGSGLTKLSDNANKLGDISDATVATNEYVDNIRSASSQAFVSFLKLDKG